MSVLVTSFTFVMPIFDITISDMTNDCVDGRTGGAYGGRLLGTSMVCGLIAEDVVWPQAGTFCDITQNIFDIFLSVTRHGIQK